MKSQNALQTCLAAALFLTFVLAPLTSKEALNKEKTVVFISQALTITGMPGMTDSPNDFDAAGGNKKESKNKKPDHVNKDKKHADEEKHKNHLYHYNRVKRKRKSHTSILRGSIKIFIAICYIAVLLCGYMSIVH